MRGFFATIKQWMFDLYKTVKNGIRQAIINDGNPYLKNRIGAAEGRMGRSMTDQELVEFVLPEELRNVFDRAIASDEAIIAEHMKIGVDANQLAQAMLDKKVITQRQFEKAKERLLAAKLVAQDELRARMIDEYMRSKRAPWRAEERELEKDFASEVDDRPNQRHYQVMSGEGWRNTLEDEIADLAAQAPARAAALDADVALDDDMGVAPDPATTVAGPAQGVPSPVGAAQNIAVRPSPYRDVRLRQNQPGEAPATTAKWGSFAAGPSRDRGIRRTRGQRPSEPQYTSEQWRSYYASYCDEGAYGWWWDGDRDEGRWQYRPPPADDPWTSGNRGAASSSGCGGRVTLRSREPSRQRR
jgi:hypothetical protein